jgi:hypothetical protein
MIAHTKAAPTLNLHSLAPIIEQMRTDHPLEHFGRNTKTIQRESGLSVLLIVMQSGAFLSEHTAPGALTVQVLEGRIAFFSEGQQVEVGPMDHARFGCAAQSRSARGQRVAADHRWKRLN